MERDNVREVAVLYIVISTHALTWSATFKDRYCLKTKLISTHALTWSATKAKCVSAAHTADFNSRAHVERDINFINRGHLNDKYFNSRAHVERDRLTPNNHSSIFISTHALTWSATGTAEITGSVLRNFNSRAHVERDL